MYRLFAWLFPFARECRWISYIEYERQPEKWRLLGYISLRRAMLFAERVR